MLNIGITCQLGRSIWSGGIKQSAINLYDCLEKCGFNPIYLNNGKKISDFKKDHKAFDISQVLYDKFPALDLIIMHGFSIPNEEVELIQKKHKNCKIILYHHGNRIAIDQSNLLTGANFQPRMKNLDEVWVPEHHDYSLQYIKAYHGTDAVVKSVPYLWSPFFLDGVKHKKNLFFDPEQKPRVVILEPNINASKTCLIPLIICETFNRAFGKSCESFSFFNTEMIKINKGAKNLIEQFSASEQQKIFLNKNWKTIDVFERLGQYVLSHQSENEMNYLYLEALYLGFPLIHNSQILKGYGYFYNKYDIMTASNQIYNAILNHKTNLEDYQEQNKRLLAKFSPSNESNINFFKKNISHLLLN
tara:strand:+ start:10131 stop:11210 length:1080 start_codon:yes stop_codon:yes gene_type:complete